MADNQQIHQNARSTDSGQRANANNVGQNAIALSASSTIAIQKKPEENDEPIPKEHAQKAHIAADDKPVKARFTVQRVALDEKEPRQLKPFQLQKAAPSSNNTGMPDTLKSGVENLSGFDLSDVKVHYNSASPAQLQAHAYAQGTDIHIAPGQERHLPHEAWHVVQQKQGRVQATMQMKGNIPVNDDAGLEKEADVMGAMAASNTLQPHEGPPQLNVNTAVQKAEVVQAYFINRGQLFKDVDTQLIYEQIQVRVDDTVKVRGHGETFYLDYIDGKWQRRLEDHEQETILKDKGYAYDEHEGKYYYTTWNNATHEFDLEELSLNASGELVSKKVDLKAKGVEGSFKNIANRKTVLDQLLERREEELALEKEIITGHAIEGGMKEDMYLKKPIEPLDKLKRVRGYVERQKAKPDEEELDEEDIDETAHAKKQYSDALVGSASKLIMAPLSTAHYLESREDMPLSHGAQKDASQYSRSAKHSLYGSLGAKKIRTMVSTKALRSGKEGGGIEAHVGLYPNAMTFLRNTARVKPPVASAKEEATETGTGELYDDTLKYKLSLCEKVAALASGLKFLTVGVYNDYPLIMVHFDLENYYKNYNAKGNSDAAEEEPEAPSDGTKKSFTAFLMNYYMGVANFLAKSAGVNISIVERSSFGFNTPSLAETGESFRINMGLMPPVYADVHAHALHMLDLHLQEMQKTKAPRKKEDHALDTSKPYFGATKKAEIDQTDDWLNFAMYPIESQGKSSITNAVRKRESLDFVNAQTFNFMATYAGKANGLGPIMASLFKSMEVSGTLSTNVDPDKTHYDYSVPAEKKSYAIDDAFNKEYEQMLKRMRISLLKIAMESKSDEFKERLADLCTLLTIENPHIELTFDLINEMLLQHAIDTVRLLGSDASMDDGYGSESEVEDEVDSKSKGGDDTGLDEMLSKKARKESKATEDAAESAMVVDSGKLPKRPLAGKKIITHNGMRALLSAVDSAVKVVYENAERLQVDVQGAYYEMSDALESANIKADVTKLPEKAHVLIRDLNACVTDGPKGQVKINESISASPAGVWIIDTTSSTQTQMAGMLELFRNSGAKVLYLVSSGFKQEQTGSDRNQYGTIRAFTDNTEEGKLMIDGILDVTKKSDKPLVVTAHIYRRVMKRLGAVPVNKNILSGSHGVESTSKKTYSGVDWSSFFDFDIDFKNEGIRQRILSQFAEAVAQVDVQADDEGAERADHSKSASSFIYANVDKSKKSDKAKVVAQPSRAWFNILANPGGGDCLLHALAGKTLNFEEIVASRAAIAPHAGPQQEGATVSGSMLYQSLHQSGFMSRDINNRMTGKHQVPVEVYRQAILVPGLYAGEEEIQAFVRMGGTPNPVYIVTNEGELRRVTTAGAIAVGLLSIMGEASFRQEVNRHITEGAIVLYKSPNHWEKITAAL